MSHPTNQASKAKEAQLLAALLWFDLSSACNIYYVLISYLSLMNDKKNGESSANQTVYRGVYRICLASIILNLAKYTEFYKRYKGIIPPDMRKVSKQLHNDIVSRGVKDFRNKVVGHIWDLENNRPLTGEEIDLRINKIMRGNINDFLHWIHNPGDNTFPNTVSSILVRLRDEIRDKYGLK